MTPRFAWARTLVLLAIVLDVPVLARVVRALTPEPRVETMELDGVPVELVFPARAGGWPAFHFVNGAHPERRTEPIVQRVTQGLASAGFVVAYQTCLVWATASSRLVRSRRLAPSPR